MTVENPVPCSKFNDVKEIQDLRFKDSLLALLNEIKFPSPSNPNTMDSEIPVASTQMKNSDLLSRLYNTLYS